MSGNLTRLGGTFTAPGGTLTFNGGTTQSLSLSLPTTFNNLAVASGTTLSETVTANNATVAGTLSNQGIIRKTDSLSATGVYTFGLTGVIISIIVPGSLSSTTVDLVGQPHPAASNGLTTNHYWNITPSGSGYTGSLTLPHVLSAPSKALICHLSGTLRWDYGRSAYTANTVTWNGLTALNGDWAIGQGFQIFLPQAQR